MPEQPIFRSGNYGVFVDGQRLQVLVEMTDRQGRPYWGSDYDHGTRGRRPMTNAGIDAPEAQA